MPVNVLHFTDFAEEGAPGISVKNAHQTSVGAHSHDFYELVYVQSGFSLHETSKAATLLIEGDLFLVQPGAAHRYVGPHSISVYNCLFTFEAISGFEKELTPLFGLENLFDPEKSDILPKIHLNLDEQKSFSRAFRRMIQDGQERLPGWQTKLRCMLICTLIDYAQAYEKHIAASDEKLMYPNYVAHALGIINERYMDESLTVSGIAKEAGVTPDYLSRQFRTLTGVGVQEYLRRYRFAKATELLTAGEGVGEVAFKVGFASLSNFSREFKKEMGVAPSAYARENS